MAHAYHHSLSSVRRFRGDVQDYLSIHEWIDGSKIAFSDHRHRALRHHSFGVYECEEKFGKTILNSAGIEVPVRTIAEQHIIEDLGFVPTVQDWLKSIDKEFWMTGRKLNLDDKDSERSPRRRRRLVQEQSG
tara:strand:+ start:1747 stop:2142 length:396 start_codon:yes stop_codon:yes gene_type:complete